MRGDPSEIVKMREIARCKLADHARLEQKFNAQRMGAVRLWVQSHTHEWMVAARSLGSADMKPIYGRCGVKMELLMPRGSLHTVGELCCKHTRIWRHNAQSHPTIPSRTAGDG